MQSLTTITSLASSKVARVAMAVLTGTGALVAAGVVASEPAGAATYEASTIGNNVAIRPCARRSCDPTGYMDIAGSIYYVYCYVSGESVSGDSIWYKGASAYSGARGYVAGYNLNTGHDPRRGIAHC